MNTWTPSSLPSRLGKALPSTAVLDLATLAVLHVSSIYLPNTRLKVLRLTKSTRKVEER